MTKTHNPPNWPRPSGYSNAVSAIGRTVFIAGQIGWNDHQQFESDDFLAQTKQVLINIAACLAAADASPTHITRMTWFVTDKREYQACLPQIGEIYREVLGRVFPAMSLLEVKGLLEERAKLEVEVTAIVPI